MKNSTTQHGVIISYEFRGYFSGDNEPGHRELDGRPSRAKVDAVVAELKRNGCFNIQVHRY